MPQAQQVQTPQTQQPQKQRKSIWVIILIGLIIAVCGGCTILFTIGAITSSKSVSFNEPRKLDASGAPIASTGRDTKFVVGDKIRYKNVELQVSQVLDKPKITYPSPKSGFKYIAVEVAVKNVDSTSYTSSSTDFELSDKDGYTYTIAYTSFSPEFSYKELRKGETQRGFVVFEVKEKAEGLKLDFTPTFFSKKITIHL